MEGEILIERLLAYARAHLYLKESDVVYFRNLLLSEFRLTEPSDLSCEEAEIAEMTVPDRLEEELKAYAVGRGLTDEADAERYAANIFGMLSPLPSEVNRDFFARSKEEGVQAACDDFYDLCVKNGYIRKTAIGRNLKWEYPDGDNQLEITVNLSKPEKNNKDIAKLLTAPEVKKYPLCALCKENEGFEGAGSHPPRRNLRTLSLTLDKERWFMQYSPYAYYDEHCIVINENHTPMKVDGSTPRKLLDFIDLFPNYFVGSNASLPIVGGSILNHEHYQGGRHRMPMHSAPVARRYASGEFSELKIGVLDWYNSVLHVEGEDRVSLSEFVAKAIYAWENFDCPACEIVSHTGKTRHNVLSPICRKEGKGYAFDLILRNNRTNERYPEGIFHVHPEYLNIKSEGIGLIEAMGLFILPPRLKRQLEEIEKILCGQLAYGPFSPADDLYAHRNMISDLVREGLSPDRADARERIRRRVGQICAGILDNTAVFKKDRNGREGFESFLRTLDLKKI